MLAQNLVSWIASKELNIVMDDVVWNALYILSLVCGSKLLQILITTQIVLEGQTPRRPPLLP